MTYPVPYVGGWKTEDVAKARTARLRQLTEYWEDVLRDTPDNAHVCCVCGEPLPKGRRGPRRLYCGDVCRKYAARERAREAGGQRFPVMTDEEFFENADVDGTTFSYTQLGASVPLGPPAKPVDDLIGQFDLRPNGRPDLRRPEFK